MLVIVASRITMNCAKHTTTSAHHGLGACAGSSTMIFGSGWAVDDTGGSSAACTNSEQTIARAMIAEHRRATRHGPIRSVNRNTSPRMHDSREDGRSGLDEPGAKGHSMSVSSVEQSR